jgi:L-lactate utilization protein LutC
MSRDKILADIREALKTPMPEAHHDAGPAWTSSAPANGKSLVETFREKFEGVGGVWVEAKGLDAAKKKIRELVKGRIWDGGELADPNTIEATVTTCDMAIAETGSFGLVARPGQGRLMSLVAPVHFVLVRRDQFVATLEDWLGWLQPRMRAAAVLITGPSRSADIEQVLTVGVHGPAKVYAVLYA